MLMCARQAILNHLECMALFSFFLDGVALFPLILKCAVHLPLIGSDQLSEMV